MVSTIYHVSSVDALSENMDFQNKNIADNNGRSATHAESSADRLTEELSGILSFNWPSANNL